jgi:hypothetical protein
LHDAELSPASDKLAIVRSDDPDGAGGSIALYRVTAVATGVVPTPICQIPAPGSPPIQARRPTWSPDGRTVLWAQPDGVYSVSVPAELENPDGTDNCSQINGGLLIAGATAPDAGPADVKPLPRGTPTPTPTPTPTRTPAVSLTDLAVKPKAFPAQRHGPSVGPSGRGTVSYRVSASGLVRFKVERRSAGRRSGGRCVAPTRRNRSAPRCRFYVPVRGEFRHVSRRGILNRLRFTGRVRGRRLGVGAYRLIAVATAAGHTASRPARRQFRIIRDRR